MKNLRIKNIEELKILSKKDLNKLKPQAEQGDFVAEVFLKAYYQKEHGYEGKRGYGDPLALSKHCEEIPSLLNKDVAFYLGIARYLGKGVEQDFKQARDYWELAKEKGHIHAEFALTLSLYFGKGISPNRRQAVKEWIIKDEQGYIPAQYYLAWNYCRGSFPESITQAYIWASVVADKKYEGGWRLNKQEIKLCEQAEELREELTQKMSNDQIDEVQELVEEFKSKTLKHLLN